MALRPGSPRPRRRPQGAHLPLLLSLVASLAAWGWVPALPGAPSALAAVPTPPDAAASATAGRFLSRVMNLDDRSVRYAVWLPPGFDGGRAWPGIVFLHGAGESGDDGVAPTKIGIGRSLRDHPAWWPCVVILPQKPRHDIEWWEVERDVLAVVDYASREFGIDPDRTALTGLSQGGHGAWLLAARTPSRWSCLAPVCGYGRPRTITPRIAELPVWAWHGQRDDVIDPRESQRIVDALRSARGDGGPEARLTLVPERGHNVWEDAYGDSTFAVWMLAQRRASAAVSGAVPAPAHP